MVTATAVKEAPEVREKIITITPPNFQRMTLLIVGNAPYVQNKFSSKAQEQIRITQEAGSTARSRRNRKKKDFQELYENCFHKSTDGWYGIPAGAFRKGMISACRVVGFQMTKAKLSIFVEADGHDKDGTPLVRITKGEPHKVEHPVRNDDGSIDLRARAMWDPGWESKVRLKWDGDQFTDTDVTNLLARLGVQVGVGEGRPDSKDSAGMDWGTFDVRSN